MVISVETFIQEKDRPQNKASPTLAQVIKDAVDNKTDSIRTGMIAKIVKYNKKKQTVDVQPVLTKKYQDGKSKELPVIYDVPVKHARAGKSFMHMPIKKGHYVTLTFSDRSIDKWKSKGGEKVDPDDTRKHSMSDAIAHVGGYPTNDPVDVDNEDDIIVKNHDGDGYVEMRLKPSGKVEILNSQGEELLNTLSDLITTIRQAVIYTCNGPMRLRHTKLAPNHRRLKTFVHKK